MMICFDLETTGLDKYNDKIIEIAMIKFDENTFKIIEKYSTFVDPEIEIPEVISNITNIFDSDVVGAPKIGDLKQELKDFIGDNVVLGHNVKFDIDFFVNNGINIKDNTFIDTFFLANFLNFTLSSLNLEILCNHYKIPFKGAHRAMNDVVATINLFEKQIKSFKKLSAKKKENISYIFSLSEDKNINYLNDLLFFDFNAILKISDFEKNILKKVGKFKGEDNLLMDLNLEFGDISEYYNFSEKIEKRKNQLLMTQNVLDSFMKKEKKLIEAPTGLGKSFAYLIPSILFSLKKGEKVYISTKTKTLQDQLYFKDLQFLKDKLGKNFNFSKLKGKRNYLSLKGFFDKIYLGNLTYTEVNLLLKINLWLFETTYGELDELNFYGEEFSIIRDLNSEGFEIISDINTYKNYEFLYKARKKLEKSNVVVVNHSLLFADLENDNQILGNIKNLVIDEAHSIEESVTESVKQRYSLKTIRDHFSKCEKILTSKNLKKIDFLNLKDNVISHLEIIDDYGYSYINNKVKDSQNYKTTLLNNDFFEDTDFSELIQKIQLNIIDIVDRFKVVEEYDFSKEIIFIEAIAKNLKIIFDKNSNNKFIKIINYSDRQGVFFDYTLLNPGEYLKKNLWNKLNSCILTSATLKIGDSFDYIKNIMQLDDFEFLSFQSDFDYKKQAMLFIPTDIGSIKNNSQDVVLFLKDFFLLVKGKVLTLLTSFSMIKKIYTNCNIDLKKENINLYAQSIGGSKMKLITFFKDSPDNSILLGTDSFWEGVDIPGDDLKYLIVHKFPFIVPTNPIFQARSVFFDDPFNDYAIPKAIIKLKQGFGRLIRTKNDKGIVILLDDRIINTKWGEKFFEAFPENINVKKGTKQNFLSILSLK